LLTIAGRTKSDGGGNLLLLKAAAVPKNRGQDPATVSSIDVAVD